MDLQLKGQHVLITGGTKGIGLACAVEFVNEGCFVTIVGRDADRLEEACIHLDSSRKAAHGIIANLRNAPDANAMIEAAEAKYGPIDVLVNAAGGAKQKPFAELEPVDWREAMDSKFFTYINVIDPLIKRMGYRGKGTIINIIGLGGKIPITTHLVGGSANAALMLATAGLAMAYASKGVRVNALNPAKTETGRFLESMEASARQQNTSVETAKARAYESIPIGRLATPLDIASAAVFLASPRAGYISGSVISIDGATRPMII